MTERAYTIQEIDDLRECCRNRYIWGRYSGAPLWTDREGHGFSRSYKEHEMLSAAEEMVRTHMLAGHTAQDLLSAEALPASCR